MNIEQKDIVITAAVRTAIGTFRGSLKNMQAHNLGSVVVKEAMKQSNLNSNDIDELIMGQVLTGAAGQNPAGHRRRRRKPCRTGRKTQNCRALAGAHSPGETGHGFDDRGQSQQGDCL